MNTKTKIAAACKVDVPHLELLVRMKRLSGKSSDIIKREIEQIAWLNGNRLVIGRKQSN